MLELNKIYNIDCLEGIKKIDDNSINAIITDPPYFVGMTHNGQKGEFADLKICEPFYRELFAEFERALKPDGYLYWFCDWRSYAFYYPILENILPVKNLLVWDKQSGPGNLYGFSHELIIFAGYGIPASGSGNNVIRDIKSFMTGAKKEDGEKLHPTQKPTALIRKLITDSTQEGDTVLDCFMGSGTTAIACKQTGRNYIGFELQEKYCEIANERISKI